MHVSVKHLTIALVCGALLAPALAAQRLGPDVKRPKLYAGADTNDAAAYLTSADRALEKTPEEAAAAFYWAARLDPSSAEALYGRRIALAMRRPSTLASYLSGTKKARESKEFRAIDSLHLRALWLDPMLYRKHDRTMLMVHYRNILRRDASLSPAEIDYAIDDYLARSSPANRAWLAYSSGRLPEALEFYATAIDRSKKAPGLRMDRARVYALQGRLVPAIQEFTQALALFQERDERKDEDVIFYDSKALIEHSIGILWARNKNMDSARAAYGRATAEDLSYYASHIALGLLALEQGDSVTATSELGLAADLAATEPYPQHLYGSVLVATGQHEQAIAPLKKAIELESFYAAPHFSLGVALERANDPTAASSSYRRFLELASRRDPQRAAATERLAALGAGSP